MPIAAIIDEKIFAVHAGLSPDLDSMDQIRSIVRPIDVSTRNDSESSITRLDS